MVLKYMLDLASVLEPVTVYVRVQPGKALKVTSDMFGRHEWAKGYVDLGDDEWKKRAE